MNTENRLPASVRLPSHVGLTALLAGLGSLPWVGFVAATVVMNWRRGLWPALGDGLLQAVRDLTWVQSGALLLMLLLLGLLVNEAAGFLGRYLVMDRAGRIRTWYARLTHLNTVSRGDWDVAQRWMWASPYARPDFDRHRLVAAVGLGALLNTALGLAAAATYLVSYRPDHSGWLLILAVLAAAALGAGFFLMWLRGNEHYNRLVRDAGRLGPPLGL